MTGKSDDRLAKADVAPRRRAPSKGYAGEGGGDGQGGGSRAGGSGGVARTDTERYYGLLAERIRGLWIVPPNITDLGKLKTDVTIDVDRQGNYRNLRIVRYSGSHVYDQAALRAVERAAKPSLPKPPDTIKENWLLLGFRFCGKDFLPLIARKNSIQNTPAGGTDASSGDFASSIYCSHGRKLRTPRRVFIDIYSRAARKIRLASLSSAT